MQALRTGWDFFQNEVLGMKWLNRLIGSILEACGLDLTSKVGGSIQFFIYDVIKIMVLLGVLILLISYIQSYFPPERTKKYLADFIEYGQIFLPPCSVLLHRFALARRSRCLSDLQVRDSRLE